MNTIIGWIANLTGIWKKVATVLPMIAGAGSLLVGAGGVLLEVAHAGNAGAALKVIQGLTSDPNTAMIIAGLTAIGIHSNHSSNVAAIASQVQGSTSTATTPPPAA